MILVIGATSFVGLPVIKELIAGGNTVRCLVRTGSNIEKLKSEIVRGLTDKPMDEEIIIKNLEFTTGNLQSPDSIYYSLKNIDKVVYLVDLKNTSFVKNFLASITRTGIKRVVFLSSTTVEVPLENPVKQAKIQSEKIISNSNLDWTIIRASMIYGTTTDGNFSSMINFVKKRGFFVIFGRGDNLIQPIHINDVAKAIRLAVDNEKTFRKIYTICGKNPIRYKDMLEIVKEKTKIKFKIIRLPLKLSRAMVNFYCKINKNSRLKPDMIDRMQVDKSYSYQEAYDDFDFTPEEFENGIEDLIKKIL